MISTDQAQRLLSGGGNVVDTEGNKIGSIGQVFLDDQTGEPEWVTTKTGLFGMSESFVPLRGAELTGDDVRVPYDKDKVKDAPRIDDENGHLSEQEEEQLYAYYGTDGVGSAAGYTPDAGTQTGVGTATYDAETRTGADDSAPSGTVGRDVSGPGTDSAMTRSEEQLRVGTETREAGRARLRKYVVTENVTKTVPVSREEVRVEREPITDANRDQALAGENLTDEEHEVVLNEERVVADKETVPVERVRLDKDVVTDEQQVDETVRKEEIDVDGGDRSSVTDAGERRG